MGRLGIIRKEINRGLTTKTRANSAISNRSEGKRDSLRERSQMAESLSPTVRCSAKRENVTNFAG